MLLGIELHLNFIAATFEDLLFLRQKIVQHALGDGRVHLRRHFYLVPVVQFGLKARHLQLKLDETLALPLDLTFNDQGAIAIGRKQSRPEQAAGDADRMQHGHVLPEGEGSGSVHIADHKDGWHVLRVRQQHDSQVELVLEKAAQALHQCRLKLLHRQPFRLQVTGKRQRQATIRRNHRLAIQVRLLGD